ncbi:MAG TPA: cupredoxin domain-containing protein [Acidimicrobiales bacterium]|nr:cupredoxin domain-containing protein [Acidimicrobiales bacterium]
MTASLGWDGHPHRRLRLRRVLAVGALVTAGALSLSACGGSPAAPSSSSRSAPSASGARAAPSHETVIIENFSFHPATFAVEPGATITVRNEDAVTHTFTAEGGSFNSGDIGPGQAKTVTAPSKKGTYPYLCQIHQFMTGVLTVR